MGAVKPIPLGLIAAAALCLIHTAAFAWSGDVSLHAQSVSAALAKDFPSPDLSFALLDSNGKVIVQRWPVLSREVPIGSLIKPFLAVAYRQTHNTFPLLHCAGKNACWLPRGHGKLGIQQAIAFSCNSYFHQLLPEIDAPSAKLTMERYSLSLEDESGGNQLQGFGMGESWKASPLQIARAYLTLAKYSHDSEIAPVIEGMSASARYGTASALWKKVHGLPVLAKTGTAPCIHRNRAPGDGLAIVLMPADSPRLALLVRVHGKPGAVAAATAGNMIAAVERITGR